MFLNRNDELNNLQIDYEKPTSTISFIFGRRRVGKTALINKYTNNKKYLQLSSFETTKELLFKNFKNRIDEYFNLNNQVIITSTIELFKYISDQEINEKLILVIENTNYLVDIDKNFLSDLYYSWNKHLKNKNLQLIVTSSIYFSSKADIEIYDKADNLIVLENLTSNYLKNIFPNLNEQELHRIYSVLGSNIHYLKFYDEKLDLFDNIKNMCLKSDSPLFKEGISIIKNNLSDVVTYLSILHAVSVGNKKIGDIAAFINLKSTYITRYMQKLVDIMVLEKKFPVNDDPKKSKFGRYEFTDNFLKFWFCFIYPNFDLINQNKSDEVLDLIKNQFIDKILKDSYKEFVLEKIERNYDEVIGYKPTKIGPWWNNKDNQIDIVAYNSQFITFLDCQVSPFESKENLEKSLMKKSQNFDTTLSRKYLIYS